MNTYMQLKSRQSKDIDEFEGIFFAFNNQQFEEGMQKIGLTVNDTKLIYSLGAGGYIRKDKSEAFSSMMDRHYQEKQQLKKEEKVLIDALVYELQNHEYCISRDIKPALEALGLAEEEIDPKILNKAIKTVNALDEEV